MAHNDTAALLPFKKIHVKLTILCSAITIAILCLFAGLYLYIAEKALTENHFLAFQHDMDSLCTNLEQQTVITFQYLKTLEQNSSFFIYLWDNDTPFTFNTMEHHREYTSLSQKALAEYQKLTEEGKWDDSPSGKYLAFRIREANGISYNVGGARISTGQLSAAQDLTARSQGKGLTVLVISPLAEFEKQLSDQRLLILALAGTGCLLLTFFAWFFTGRLLHPILENQRRQIQFVSNASHELRTPLSVIRSCISIQPPRFEETITKECVHMGQLIDDMLILTSLENKSRPLMKEPVEPDTFLLNLYEQMEPLAREKGLSLHISLPDTPLPHFPAEPGKLNQVMMILIQNAVSYTPAGGNVTLRIFSQKKGICFQVEDTGPGISEEDKMHIFERFYRAESSHSAQAHFGLGLCIAREIMAAHHGQLTVSDTPGGGSTFTCFFPG